MAFLPNMAYISEESYRIFMKILPQMHPWTRKSVLNFGSNPDLESTYPWRTYMRSLVALVLVLYFTEFYFVTGLIGPATNI